MKGHKISPRKRYNSLDTQSIFLQLVWLSLLESRKEYSSTSPIKDETVLPVRGKSRFIQTRDWSDIGQWTLTYCIPKIVIVLLVYYYLIDYHYQATVLTKSGSRMPKMFVLKELWLICLHSISKLKVYHFKIFCVVLCLTKKDFSKPTTKNKKLNHFHVKNHIQLAWKIGCNEQLNSHPMLKNISLIVFVVTENMFLPRRQSAQ